MNDIGLVTLWAYRQFRSLSRNFERGGGGGVFEWAQQNCKVTQTKVYYKKNAHNIYLCINVLGDFSPLPHLLTPLSETHAIGKHCEIR